MNFNPNTAEKTAFKSHQIVEGQWKNGKIHGYGHILFPDGNYYIGDFIDGFKDGQGIFTWHNGNKYTGYWEKNRMHGQGIFLHAKNKAEFKGFFTNGNANCSSLSKEQREKAIKCELVEDT